MLLTPLLARLGRRAGLRARKAAAMEDGIGDPGPIEAGRTIVIGHGRVGRIVCDVLQKQCRSFIAIDRDPDEVTRSRGAGRNLVYGNATRHELLQKCGLAEAPVVVVTMHDAAAAEQVVAAIRADRPDVPIVVRARDAAHAVRLFNLGATEVVREVLEASLEIASTVLQTLGLPMGKVIAIIHDERDARKRPLREGRATE
jgi:CPA2 family monovalent cation:H+ antiporter-2